MVGFWVAIALLLYLIPIFVMTAARLSESRPSPALALDIVIAVALDLLSILVLSKWVVLETAVLISRGAWLAASPVLLRGHWGRIRGGLLAHARSLGIAVGGAATGILLSLTLSVPYAIWDRQWHIPLVASIRGQRAPFWNVYEHGGQLYYHYAGDVLAAVVQVLSFDHLHSSNALSRAHDVMFGLVGFFLGLVLPSLGVRRFILIVATIAATLLAGPATLLRDGEVRLPMGHSIINLLTLSFRPHASLSYLLIFGFAAASLLPVLGEHSIPRKTTILALFASTALLTLSDEASLMAIGVMLGAVWLLAPEALATSRLRGLAVLTGLAATIGAVIATLGGTLARGAPRHSTSLVPWQIPGFYQPSIPLADPRGRALFAADFLMVFGTLAVGLVVVSRCRRRQVIVSFAAYLVLATFSLLPLAGMNTDGDGLNNHRFVTALLLLSPLFAFYWLAQSSIDRRRSMVVGLLFLTLVPAVFSTVDWLAGPAAPQLYTHRGFWGDDKFYDTDCRQRAGAAIGQIPNPTYVAQTVWYLVAGCRPLFAPGPEVSQDNLQVIVGWPNLGAPGVQKLGQWVGHEQPIQAYCSSANEPDPVCALLHDRGECQRLTDEIDQCTLTSEARHAFALPREGR